MSQTAEMTTAAPAAAAAPTTESSAAPVTTTSAPATSGASESTTSQSATVGAEDTGITEAGEFQPAEGASLEEIIAQRLNDARAEREKASGATTEQTEEERLAAELETGKTEEEKTAEGKTEAAAGETTEQTPEFDLDEPDFSTKWLDTLAAEKKVTFADDRTKGQLFKIVREHSEYKGIAEQFGGDIEAAKSAQVHASSFMHFDDLYENAATADGTRTFLEALAARQQEAPVLDAQGQPVDVVSAMFNNMREMDLQFFEKQFAKEGDDEALAALEVLRERITPNRAPATEDELPPHLAKREAAVKEREQALARTQQQQKEAVRAHYEQSVASDLDTQISKIIDPVLGKAAFADVIKTDCREKMFARIEEVLEKNPLYGEQSKRALAKDPTPENRAALVAMKMKWFNTVGPQIIRSTIKEYQNPVVQAQQQRDTRQAAQADRSRTEPKGPAVSTGPQTQLTKEQQLDKTRADLTTKLGRSPNTEEMVLAWMQQKQASRQGGK